MIKVQRLLGGMAILGSGMMSLMGGCTGAEDARVLASSNGDASTSADASGQVDAGAASPPPRDADGSSAPPLAPPKNATIHQRGVLGSDVTPPTRSATLLAGGGSDNDDAMKALVEAGGAGDAVILRMDDTGGAYADYFVELGAHSATEIVFDPLHGNDDAVAGSALLADLRALADDLWIERRIDEAEIVFFAGGNQTKYVDVWHDTRLAFAVKRLAKRGGAVGGTSAGMHVLGGLVHTPRGPGDSVRSVDALDDPYIDPNEIAGSRSLDFAESPFLLPAFANVITDTHWTERNRLGRSLVFLARAIEDKRRSIGELQLIACDEGVAVLFDAKGIGHVYGPPAGTGHAFLFRPDGPPERCADDQTLEWKSGVPFLRAEGTPAGTATIDLSADMTASPRARATNGGATLP